MQARKKSFQRLMWFPPPSPPPLFATYIAGLNPPVPPLRKPSHPLHMSSQARKKSFQQQMLLSRSSSKQPIIGRDRLAILRANGTLPHVNSGIPSTIGQNKRTAAATPATHVTVEVLPEEGQNREPGPD